MGRLERPLSDSSNQRRMAVSLERHRHVSGVEVGGWGKEHVPTTEGQRHSREASRVGGLG